MWSQNHKSLRMTRVWVKVEDVNRVGIMNAFVCHATDFEFFLQERGVKFKWGSNLLPVFFSRRKFDSSLQDGLTEHKSKSQKPD